MLQPQANTAKAHTLALTKKWFGASGPSLPGESGGVAPHHICKPLKAATKR
jgi:hypothetical protein